MRIISPPDAHSFAPIRGVALYGVLSPYPGVRPAGRDGVSAVKKSSASVVVSDTVARYANGLALPGTAKCTVVSIVGGLVRASYP